MVLVSEDKRNVFFGHARDHIESSWVTQPMPNLLGVGNRTEEVRQVSLKPLRIHGPLHVEFHVHKLRLKDVNFVVLHSGVHKGPIVVLSNPFLRPVNQNVGLEGVDLNGTIGEEFV